MCTCQPKRQKIHSFEIDPMQVPCYMVGCVCVCVRPCVHACVYVMGCVYVCCIVSRHVDVRKNYSQADLLLTMGTNLPGALTLHNFPRTLMDITKPSGERLELASIDILRDRERQVPRFNHYRRSMNLVPYKSIDEISPDKVRAC